MDIYNFHHSCRCGRLQEAQLFLLENPSLDVSSNDERAFRTACYYGNLAKGQQKTQSVFCIEVAQWLLSIKPTIDVSFNNDE